jgi:hypothetical protein
MPAILTSLAFATLCLALLLTVRTDKVAGYAAAFGLGIMSVVGNLSAPGLVIISAYLFIMVCTFIVIVRRHEKASRPNVASVLFTLSLFLILPATYLSDSGGLFFQVVTLSGIGFTVLLFAQFGEADNQVFLRAFFAICLFQVAICIAEVTHLLASPWGLRNNFLRSNPLTFEATIRAQGTTGHPSILGIVLALGILVCILNPARLRSTPRLIISVILSTGVILSGTRSVVIALLIVLAIRAVTQRGRDKVGRLLIIVGVAGVAATAFASTLYELYAGLRDSGSYTNRLGVLQSIPSLLDQDFWLVLFGGGVGEDSRLFAEGVLSSGTLQVVDNQLINTFAHSGLVGLSCLLVAIVVRSIRASAFEACGIALCCFMFMSLDLLTWYLPTLLFSWLIVVESRTFIWSRPPSGVRRADIASGEKLTI